MALKSVKLTMLYTARCTVKKMSFMQKFQTADLFNLETALSAKNCIGQELVSVGYSFYHFPWSSRTIYKPLRLFSQCHRLQ
jgi:hypothetical protein